MQSGVETVCQAGGMEAAGQRMPAFYGVLREAFPTLFSRAQEERRVMERLVCRRQPQRVPGLPERSLTEPLRGAVGVWER